jgi:uncharacterized repeat protein (TIGR03803 family)
MRRVGTVAVTIFAGAALALAAGADAPVRSATVKGLTVLYSFQGAPDGSAPNGGVVVDAAGNVFGTTLAGGSANDGAVFALQPRHGAYAESVVHSFTGTDGASPYAAPLADAGGDLFVTASAGGSDQDGSVVELSPQSGGYGETATFSFDATNGANPSAGLAAVGGTLYTTATNGGAYGYGAIVALSADGLGATDVYDFQNAPDGAYPQAGLVADASGALYGTTYYGGSASCSHGNNHLFYHCGTVFKFVPSQSGGTETVLWTFSGGDNGDGADPNGGLVVDKHGNLYGTTVFGGGTGCGKGGTPPGCGAVFELKRAGTHYSERILHAFSGAPDGQYPYAGLTAKGELYGTTSLGGTVSSVCGLGCGTIFSLAKSGASYSVLHAFEASEGEQPVAPLFAKGSILYGTTSAGGSNACGCGSVFEFVP